MSHLPELLAELLSETDARDLVDRVGLDAKHIEFRGTSVNIWNNVLRESRKQPGKLKAIVDQVIERYPDHADRLTIALNGYPHPPGKGDGRPDSWRTIGAVTTALFVILPVLYLVGRQVAPPKPAILEGYIVDAEESEPLAGVTLTIEDWDTLDGQSPTAVTDAAGRFRFDNLRPSADASQQVRLIARKPGYERSTTDPLLGATGHPIKLRPKTTLGDKP